MLTHNMFPDYTINEDHNQEGFYIMNNKTRKGMFVPFVKRNRQASIGSGLYEKSFFMAGSVLIASYQEVDKIFTVEERNYAAEKKSLLDAMRKIEQSV